MHKDAAIALGQYTADMVEKLAGGALPGLYDAARKGISIASQAGNKVLGSIVPAATRIGHGAENWWKYAPQHFKGVGFDPAGRLGKIQNYHMPRPRATWGEAFGPRADFAANNTAQATAHVDNWLNNLKATHGLRSVPFGNMRQDFIDAAASQRNASRFYRQNLATAGTLGAGYYGASKLTPPDYVEQLQQAAEEAKNSKANTQARLEQLQKGGPTGGRFPMFSWGGDSRANHQAEIAKLQQQLASGEYAEAARTKAQQAAGNIENQRYGGVSQMLFPWKGYSTRADVDDAARSAYHDIGRENLGRLGIHNPYPSAGRTPQFGQPWDESGSSYDPTRFRQPTPMSRLVDPDQWQPRQPIVPQVPQY